ncbi:S-adenosyl-L-methionine:benzoic acid/salicylic acid carboxyl methyltransferase 3-like [Vicia villosa]|uniref:S-adenosyl-L-methionine:benzoic acid/salicylic acid carboxyl methyltransferase 3-like n=1 Tax=Vicia villosa TaxID=3911 RepID=UPI00273BFCC3|nr:S-adenosyl-L-methionine:benzoic acid/salicylic acid carboxyl methyltransferase 3-like [Vicia villosa]
MDVEQRVHMIGGHGEESYANNSLVQGNVISSTKLIREKVITSLYSNTFPSSLTIADMGCSSGPNTLSVVSETIEIVEKICKERNHLSPKYIVYLNDLAGNDFNSVFKSLDNFKEKLSDEIKTEIGNCYFFGVPGSFYGRVFPDQNLHFVHSSFSLHWLSKVPEGLNNNKGAIYIQNTSPSNVIKAYYEQFQKDFSFFIKCRAEEIVEGGCMILTFLGRRGDDPSSKECCYIPELLATALNDMVLEGIIEEDKVNNFNIPNYYPCPSEVKFVVLNEGSFNMNHLEVSEVDLNVSINQSGYKFAQAMRAVFEPLLVSHFGETIIEDAFNRYQEILADRMTKEIIKSTYFTISLTRKSL